MRQSYKDFEATELFCPHCKKAVPVRKRLLLILPEGEKFDAARLDFAFIDEKKKFKRIPKEELKTFLGKKQQ